MVLACTGSAWATIKNETSGAQPDKQAACDKAAGDRKDDERQAFMAECLSTAKLSQRDKMKKCNVEAKGKTGDERKKFMSECLKA
jgi:hypothetical protein